MFGSTDDLQQYGSFTVQIVPMENEKGRDLVEAGNLCERKNGRGVDTNRNWDHKEKDYDPNEEYPGTKPFRHKSCFLLSCYCACT